MSEGRKRSFADDVMVNVVAGGVARGTAAVSLHPIDLVKTRMQFQRRHEAGKNAYYRSAWHGLRSTLATEGPSGLYRGLLVRLLYVVPSAAVNFTIYGEVMRTLSKKDASWTRPLIAAGAGVTARAIQTAVRTPFDVIKQQLQVEGMHAEGATKKVVRSRGAVETMRLIRRHSSVKGFWSGFGVTILRDCVFAAVYFGSYEGLKWLETKVGLTKKRISFLKYGIAGAGAGAIGTVCSIPIDVVKTRLQTQAEVPLEQRQYRGAMHAARSILANEGLRSFWRGVGPRVGQTIPAAAITFTTYEFIKSLLVAS